MPKKFQPISHIAVTPVGFYFSPSTCSNNLSQKTKACRQHDSALTQLHRLTYTRTHTQVYKYTYIGECAHSNSSDLKTTQKMCWVFSHIHLFRHPINFPLSGSIIALEDRLLMACLHWGSSKWWREGWWFGKRLSENCK